MDELILYKVGRVRVFPFIVAAAISFALVLHPMIGIAGGVSPTEVKGYSSRYLNTQDLGWIINADANIQRLVRNDTLPRAKVLEDLRYLWQSRFTDDLADSVPPAASPLEKLANMQIDHISSLLDVSEGPPGAPGIDGDVNLDEAARAITQLATLIPLVRAARDSLRSSLLVVSSVGCKCELERCATMAGLYASIRADTLIGPMAMVDVMEFPPLEDLLGPVDIPYWILFTEDGRPGTLVGGDSDPEDVSAGIASWFGTPRPSQTKPDRTDDRR